MHVYPHYSFQLAHVSNIWVNGAAGSGYIRFKSQTTDPATPEAGQVVIYSDSTVSNIARMSMLTSSGAVLVFFRDQVDTIRNASGSAMTKGQVVYKNGANGTTATVELAKADAALTAGAVGLVLATTLANNSFGTIITKGTFRGINTTAFSQGDILYVSPTVAGELTNVRPNSPYFDVKVGTVITSSANGIVDLTPQPYVPTPFEDMNRVLGQRTLVKGPAAAHAIGPISILGQVTTVTSQTGTGSKFVMDTSPTLVTPNIGVATGASVSVTGVIRTTAAEDSQFQMALGGQEWRMNMASGSSWYVYDVTNAKFPFTIVPNSTASFVINGAVITLTGTVTATATVKTGGYTVATLPAGTVGMRAYVTDATAPAYNAALVGGGAVTVPVFYNGAAWVSA